MTSHQPHQAIILFSRGGYSSAPQEELDQLAAAVQVAFPSSLVTGAFADKGVPWLPEALQRCAETGVQQIVVLPLFIPGDRNLRQWLAKVILRWRKYWIGQAVEVILADSLGDHPALGKAIIRAIQTAEQGDHVAVNAPKRWANNPAADWSVIPPHRYHVLLCQGPRCTAVGAGELWAYLAQRLDEYSLAEKPHGVLTVQTGCLYPCNLGPVMVVYPNGVWYCGLTKTAVDWIVVEHFIGGQMVEQYARYPGPTAQKRPVED